MESNENVMKTGTTTLAMKCKDGIILAADSRATSGHMIVSKDIQKIIPITERIAVTIAGTASDAVLLARYIEAELRLKRIRTQRDITVKEAANLLARFTYGNIRRPSMIPGITHFIIGGLDDTGSYIYDIYPDGSISEISDYISSGSGSPFVYGLLEAQYKNDSTIAENTKLAVKGISAAMQRDSASGNSINVISITEEGIKKTFQKVIDTRIEAD